MIYGVKLSGSAQSLSRFRSQPRPAPHRHLHQQQANCSTIVTAIVVPQLQDSTRLVIDACFTAQSCFTARFDGFWLDNSLFKLCGNPQRVHWLTSNSPCQLEPPTTLNSAWNFSRSSAGPPSSSAGIAQNSRSTSCGDNLNESSHCRHTH